MKTEEINKLVPDQPLPCPRCQSPNVTKSLWVYEDENYWLGWRVELSCECGLTAPSPYSQNTKEKAIEKLKELIVWWNKREPNGQI